MTEIEELKREVAYIKALLDRTPGYWIKPNTRPNSVLVKCSHCGRISYNHLLENPYYFCPWCGSPMVASHEDLGNV